MNNIASPRTTEEVYDVLLASLESADSPTRGTRIENWILIAITACVVLAMGLLIAGAWYPGLKPSAYLLILLAVIVAFVHAIVVIVRDVRQLSAPVKLMVSGVKRGHLRDLKLAAKFIDTPRPALVEVRDRLDYDVGVIRARFGLLVGATEKLGIFPAALALYFAYAKYKETAGESDSADYLLIVIVASYLGAFIGHAATERLADFRETLNAVIRVREKHGKDILAP